MRAILRIIGAVTSAFRNDILWSMDPTPELVQRLYQNKVEAARRMSFAQKFMAGAELFDFACSVSLSGIRSQNPAFTEEQVQAELRRRIEIGRRIEERP